jgi:hypothetical protein
VRKALAAAGGGVGLGGKKAVGAHAKSCGPQGRNRKTACQPRLAWRATGLVCDGAGGAVCGGDCGLLATR